MNYDQQPINISYPYPQLLSELGLNARPPGAAICLRGQKNWPKSLTGRSRASAGTTCAVGYFYWYYCCTPTAAGRCCRTNSKIVAKKSPQPSNPQGIQVIKQFENNQTPYALQTYRIRGIRTLQRSHRVVVIHSCC